MAKPTKNSLGKALRIYRAEHNLTQRDLGLRLGLDNTIISLLERGYRQPTTEQASKLAKLDIVIESTEAVA